MKKIENVLNKNKRIGLDSMTFIYHFENNKNYSNITELIFENISKGKNHSTTSILTYLELIVLPTRENRLDLVEKYKEIISGFHGIYTQNLNFQILNFAGELMAKHKIKALDAIQIATANNFGAEIFITNDKYLKKLNGKIKTKIIILGDFVE